MCRMVFPASAAAVNSASVDNSATVAWHLDLYAITPPAIMCAIPVTERLCALSLPQSESTCECVCVLSIGFGNFESRSESVTGCSSLMLSSSLFGFNLQ